MLICPVCKNSLHKQGKSYLCSLGHCFDISKKGYVNLLQSSSSKKHGDDKLMAKSRQAFLNTGAYAPLLNEICKLTENRKNIVDIGCGECYYSQGIFDHNSKIGYPTQIVSIDISKETIEVAAARTKGKDITLAVAGCTKIPIQNSSVDCAVSVFAPISETELCRILKDDAILVRVTPAKEHLIELKNAVYDNPIYNDKLDLQLNGLRVIEFKRLTYKFSVTDTENIINLFTMTPYYYKTSKSDLGKLDKIKSLYITADFDITVYKKDIT